MEQIYALGVSSIEWVQYWFTDLERYLELVNNLVNPHYVLEILFPLISIVDSVFASQLLLCITFGGWLSGLMKWWLLEDRPYWWVRETTFYSDSMRPWLMQTSQTCETGPGSPSGHSLTAASLFMLFLTWAAHVCNDRKWNMLYWKLVLYPLGCVTLVSVMVARMYVAAHFPHQCLFGCLLGLFIVPVMCVYVTDPFIWQYGKYRTMPVKRAVAWHVLYAALAVLSCVATYCVLTLYGIDPNYTVELAYRRCADCDKVFIFTTPLYALIKCTGSLAGLALSVTPAVAKYRHYTKNRSTGISTFLTGFAIVFLKTLEKKFSKSSDVYYLALFILNAMTPAIMLRLVPALAMWPFSSENKPKAK